MLDEEMARTTVRRTRAVLVGDTVRLAVVVLVVGAADAVVVQLLGWRALVALAGPPVVALLAARRGRPALVDVVEPTTVHGGSGATGPGNGGQAWLTGRVSALALGRGTAPPQVRPWPGRVVNAYGLGSGRRAVLHVGDATAHALDDAGLDAVLLHELHHLRPSSRLRADAWLVAGTAATTLLVPAAVPLLALGVVGVLRFSPVLLVVALTGPSRLPRALWAHFGPPVSLLLWPVRLRAAAAHRRDLLADLSAAAVVGPAAVRRALGTMLAVLPGPAEVDATRASGSPSAVSPRTGRRCTVPFDGERPARLAVLGWSVAQRCDALARLEERVRARSAANVYTKTKPMYILRR